MYWGLARGCVNYLGGNAAPLVEDSDDAPPDTAAGGDRHGAPGRRASRREYSSSLGVYRIEVGRVAGGQGVLEPEATPIEIIGV